MAQYARWDPTIVMAVHNNDNILMVHYEDLPNEDKDTITKLQKSFRRSVCCPTPKHVTAQLFGNFHYQEFYYIDRQIQSKLETDVSLRKP